MEVHDQMPHSHGVMLKPLNTRAASQHSRLKLFSIPGSQCWGIMQVLSLHTHF